jgi:hypothetical protein
VGLSLPVDGVGQAGQLRAGGAVLGQVHDGGCLEQVGDHVLGEPHVGLVAG